MEEEKRKEVLPLSSMTLNMEEMETNPHGKLNLGSE